MRTSCAVSSTLISPISLPDTQVLIRWALQRGTSCLPKSTTPARIASNLQVMDWELSPSDMAALSRLQYQARMVDGAFLLAPTGPYR